MEPPRRPLGASTNKRRILVIGSAGFTSVGESLVRGANELGHEGTFVDSWQAYEAPVWLRRFNWRLRDRRPTHLVRFERDLLGLAQEMRPDIVIVTGQMPVTRRVLSELGSLGVQRVNYSTDDPWNRNSRSHWFMEALREYDHVFTPRRANIEQLRQLGGPAVHYLPFAFDPVHCVGPPLTTEDAECYASDLVFVGGADSDRVPLIRPLVESGLSVSLYGGKWERYPWARAVHRGEATPEVLRRATLGAEVSLCLLRRSNRDGHVMRTFEMAAAGVCMLVEWSDEHEAILGRDGENVAYFRSASEMVRRATSLLADGPLRVALRRNVVEIMAAGKHTYRDRMFEIVQNVLG